MSVTYVLIHGAWHGSWCWRKVIPLLKQTGSRVLAPDLPGSGQDQTPLVQVSFARSVERVVDLLRREPDPVILVGHSMAGMVISQVAEEIPEKIRWLTYLTALLPLSGETGMQTQTLVPLDDALLECIDLGEARASLRKEALPFFYHDCSREDSQFAWSHLRPQAMSIVQTPVSLTHRFESVPRAYLRCTADRVVTPELQEALTARSLCEQAILLPSGHSPFLSMPEQLVARLHSLALVDPSPFTWSAV